MSEKGYFIMFTHIYFKTKSARGRYRLLDCSMKEYHSSSSLTDGVLTFGFQFRGPSEPLKYSSFQNLIIIQSFHIPTAERPF
jgi:hypothetical protein